MGSKGYFGKKIINNIVEGTKTTMGAKNIENNFYDIKENFNELVNGAKGNFKVPKTNLSFEEMVEKYNITPEQIKINYKNNAYLFYIMLGMFFITFSLMIYYLAGGKYIPFVVSFVVSGVPLVKMFEASVNCYRIKKRKFVTIKEWKEAGEYIPTMNIEK